MSDSGKILGDCRHGRHPEMCYECERAENDRLRWQVSAYQAELAEVVQTLGCALGYPVDCPEIGGAGTGVMVGEHTPATLAAEAARELEKGTTARAEAFRAAAGACRRRAELYRGNDNVLRAVASEECATEIESLAAEGG